MSIYNDTIHRNDGTYMHNNVEDDEVWQNFWKKIIAFHHPLYTPPFGPLGQKFIQILTNEWNGVRLSHWNSERPILFPILILRKSPSANKSSEINRRIKLRIDAWLNNKFDELVNDTIEEASFFPTSTSIRQNCDTFKIFNALALNGKLKEATNILTSQTTTSILLPTSIDKKTNLPVIEVLKQKHPEIKINDLTNPLFQFEEYDPPLQHLPLQFFEEDVTAITSKLTGSGGPSSLDSTMLQTFLLRYGQASHDLRVEMAAWAEWLSNNQPPWASYRAAIAGRLIAFDKMPGVRPISIGESWRRLWAKMIIKQTISEAKHACGISELCVGLEAGIEGAIHAMQQKFYNTTIDEDTPKLNNHTTTNTPTQQTIITTNITNNTTTPPSQPSTLSHATLIDASNGFNELSRYHMLWTIKHLWPKASLFTFNCYRHFAMLIVRNNNQPITILHSMEGVQQGDPLAMILYGLSLTPLIKKLQLENHTTPIPTPLQPWFADDSAIISHPTQTAKFLSSLLKYGPSYGYFIQPEKSFHICPITEETEAKQIFTSHGININYVRGHEYLGSFLGENESKISWLQPQINKWTNYIETFSEAAKQYPHSAYTAFTHCLQTQWIFLCRTTPNISTQLQPLETAISTQFIPALFNSPLTDPSLRQLLSLPVNKGGLNILNPVQLSDILYNSSKSATTLLVDSLLTQKKLDLYLHSSKVKESKINTHHQIQSQHTNYLQTIQNDPIPYYAKNLPTNQTQGHWLSNIPNSLNGTVLSTEEFRDNLLLRYNLTPSNLPNKCDGCQQPFTITHALNCKHGGLINLRHTEIANEWAHLCSLALPKSTIIHEPTIFPSNVTTTDVPHNPKTPNSPNHNTHIAYHNAKGDKGVIGFWSKGRMTIFDMRIVNTNSPTYQNSTPIQILNRMENQKTNKYEYSCLEHRRHFTPIVFSTDGLPGIKTLLAMKRLASLLSIKLSLPYSKTMFFVRSRMSIALARCNTLLLRLSRDPNNNPTYYHPILPDGTAINAFTVIRELFD